jgi:iron(III) transport system substrate-binding protein
MRESTGPVRRRQGGRSSCLLAIAALSVVLAACGSDSDGGGTAKQVAGDWDAIVEAAKKEGAVTVYTSAGNSDVVFKAFEKAYPDIRTTFVRQPTADLLTRLDQEIEVDAKGADVAYHAQPAWFIERGKTDNLAPIVYGPAADGWPADAKSKYYATILTTPFEAVWNKNKGKPIEDVGAFVDQAGDARVGLLDPASSVAAMSQYQAWIDAFGDDFLERLAKLKTTVFPSTVPLTQAIASGEQSYGLPIPVGVVNPLVAEGAPVGHGIPEKGSVGYDYNAGVLANAPHPNAAMVFMDWLIRKDTLELIVKELSPGATPVKVPRSLDRESIDVYEVADWPQTRQDEFIAKFNELFQR